MTTETDFLKESLYDPHLLTLVALLALSACNTVAGAGKDVSNAGHAVSSSARQTQAQM